MVAHFCLIRNFLPSSNGCKLIENGHSFVNLRKYLCFCFFMQQRKFFCSIKRTFSPKQLQNAPKKDTNLRLLQKKGTKIGSSNLKSQKSKSSFGNEVEFLINCSLPTDKPVSIFHRLVNARARIQKKTFERGRIGPVSKVFTTAP